MGTVESTKCKIDSSSFDNGNIKAVYATIIKGYFSDSNIVIYLNNNILEIHCDNNQVVYNLNDLDDHAKKD